MDFEDLWVTNHIFSKVRRDTQNALPSTNEPKKLAVLLLFCFQRPSRTGNRILEVTSVTQLRGWFPIHVNEDH